MQRSTQSGEMNSEAAFIKHFFFFIKVLNYVFITTMIKIEETSRMFLQKSEIISPNCETCKNLIRKFFFGDAGTYGLIYLYFLLDGKIKSNQKFQHKLGIGKYVCNILLLKISGLCLCKVQYLISKCDNVKFS